MIGNDTLSSSIDEVDNPLFTIVDNNSTLSSISVTPNITCCTYRLDLNKVAETLITSSLILPESDDRVSILGESYTQELGTLQALNYRFGSYLQRERLIEGANPRFQQVNIRSLSTHKEPKDPDALVTNSKDLIQPSNKVSDPKSQSPIKTIHLEMLRKEKNLPDFIVSVPREGHNSVSLQEDRLRDNSRTRFNTIDKKLGAVNHPNGSRLHKDCGHFIGYQKVPLDEDYTLTGQSKDSSDRISIKDIIIANQFELQSAEEEGNNRCFVFDDPLAKNTSHMNIENKVHGGNSDRLEYQAGFSHKTNVDEENRCELNLRMTKQHNFSEDSYKDEFINHSGLFRPLLVEQHNHSLLQFDNLVQRNLQISNINKLITQSSREEQVLKYSPAIQESDDKFLSWMDQPVCFTDSSENNALVSNKALLAKDLTANSPTNRREIDDNNEPPMVFRVLNIENIEDSRDRNALPLNFYLDREDDNNSKIVTHTRLPTIKESDSESLEQMRSNPSYDIHSKSDTVGSKDKMYHEINNSQTKRLYYSSEFPLKDKRTETFGDLCDDNIQYGNSAKSQEHRCIVHEPVDWHQRLYISEPISTVDEHLLAEFMKKSDQYDFGCLGFLQYPRLAPQEVQRNSPHTPEYCIRKPASNEQPDFIQDAKTVNLDSDSALLEALLCEEEMLKKKLSSIQSFTKRLREREGVDQQVYERKSLTQCPEL